MNAHIDALREIAKLEASLAAERAVSDKLLWALKGTVAVYDQNITGYLVGDAFDKARTAIAECERNRND